MDEGYFEKQCQQKLKLMLKWLDSFLERRHHNTTLTLQMVLPDSVRRCFRKKSENLTITMRSAHSVWWWILLYSHLQWNLPHITLVTLNANQILLNDKMKKEENRRCLKTIHLSCRTVWSSFLAYGCFSKILDILYNQHISILLLLIV